MKEADVNRGMNQIWYEKPTNVRVISSLLIYMYKIWKDIIDTLSL